MNKKEFTLNLQSARNEKDVENCYRSYLNSELGKLSIKDDKIGTIASPYGTDGHFKYKNLDHNININCLFEFKYDVDLLNKSEVSKVLIQVIYYLKKFELKGEFFIPTTVMIGDINECFMMHTNPLLKYMGRDIDWSIAPSQAYIKNNDLLKDIIADENINPYIDKIDENFSGLELLKHINSITKDNRIKVRITVQNVHIIFKSFEEKIFGKNVLNPNDSVNLFVQCLIDRENNFLHPHKKNLLVTKSFGTIKVNGNQYNSFINYFDVDLSPSEKETLTSIQDRLIQDETRRRKGEFFTPTPWVNEAHKMISESFGEDWKEKYIVWDPAAGTANLTRDYKFKELYISTINQSDIDTINQMGYNHGSIKFQYDFLNDGIKNGVINVTEDIKLPDGLKRAILEGKDIIVFMNPPYGGATEFGENSKKDIANTKIAELMKIDEWGAVSQQLYAQFLYRLSKLNNKNINICLYSPPLLLSGESYKKFREKFFADFNFYNGFLMNASEFQDTSEWGLSFSIWKNGECLNKENFNYIVKINDGFEIINRGYKNIYNTDKKIPASKWVREKIKNYKNVLLPSLNGPLKIKDSNTFILENSLGYMHNNANNVIFNPTYVSIYSSTFASAHGLSILKENYKNVISLFTARKSISSNWINQKDEYMAPNESHELYQQFNNDAIVYSLFNTSSNQSSMRQVQYKDKLWDIKNEFFWVSKEEMKELAEKYKFDELYKDVRDSENRYVYKVLKDIELSPDAKELLEMSKELVRKSFEWRKLVHDEHPEYHLNAWDSGWYQIKKILNEYYKEDLKTFTIKYKEFEDRLRPMVYELGFLKK